MGLASSLLGMSLVTRMHWTWIALAMACSSRADPNQESKQDSGGEPPAEQVDVSGCAMDVHQHFASNVAFGTASDNLVALMASVPAGGGTGVPFALVMPPPQSGTSPLGAHYTYEDDHSPSLAQAVIDQGGTLGMVAGGGTLMPWIEEAADSGRSIDAAEKQRFKDTAEELLDDGALGFGELAVLHISYSASHPFLEVPADHPLYLALAEVAATNGVPMDIHLELVSSAGGLAVADLPSSCFKDEAHGGNNNSVLRENQSGFEALLDHADATVVWSHVGWDNTGHLTAERLDALLSAHPNLVASLKMLNTPGPCQVLDNRPLAEDGTLNPDWAEVFTAHPDQFVLGADEFVGTGEGSTAGSPSTLGTWSLIDSLPPEQVQAFACDNPRRIYHLER